MTNNNQSVVETMQPCQRAVVIAQEVATEQLQTLLEQEIARIKIARAFEDINHGSFIGTGPYTVSVDPDNSSRLIWTSSEEQQRRMEEERRIMNESFRNSLLWGTSNIVVDTTQPRSIGMWEQISRPYVSSYNRADFGAWRDEEKSSVDKFLDKLGILDETQREFHKKFIRKDLEFDK